ncbi:D-alanine--D-alanine ligase family protein [Aminicella lysinilytica]|uniref:D-alanine--D-alanine ligase family protein n=1 Tax=Aminicella lysinilytica TaxID=433323 RepID=UPI0026EFE7BF|nr:D-alanine--D-alanine ligase family protein [Aminicella lysinilytica]
MDRIGIFFGGKSNEYEISLLSASAAMRAIDRNKHQVVSIGITRQGDWKLYEGDIDNIADDSWEKSARDISIGDIKDMMDFAFPVLHGPYGEDGKIQGVFETLDIPYAGCGVLSSALCMDKASAKEVFVANHVPTGDYVLIFAEEVAADVAKAAGRADDSLPYPMFVKPANMGSSVGISKVRNIEQLQDALKVAARYDRRIIVEEGIDCREVEVGIMGNSDPQVSGVGEIMAKNDFYDYEAKYSDDAGTEIIIPAQLPEAITGRIRKVARDAYKALDCEGFARIDFLVEKETGKVYVSEINTIPGFTKFSMFPSLWQERGVDFSETIERIIGYGYERYNAKNNR